MNARLETLAKRRDWIMALAKILLLACTLAWLAVMVLYDREAEGPVAPTILLTTRTTYLLLLARIDTIQDVRIWGGPATLFGASCFVSAIAVISALAFARAWLNHRRFSRLGLAFALLAIVSGAVLASSGLRPLHPIALKPAAFEKLVAAIDAREPGLIARLRAGERPALPRIGSGSRHMTVDPNRSLLPVIPADQPLLADQADAEGLRFALAQQASAAGDRATLRRLLPIALPMPPTDQSARNDIAHRLEALGQAASTAPVPPADAAAVAAGAARWRMILGWIIPLRALLQTLLWSGLACLMLGLVMRSRHARLAASMTELDRHQPVAPPTDRKRNFGLRAQG